MVKKMKIPKKLRQQCWENIFGKQEPEEEELEPCPCGSDEPCE